MSITTATPGSALLPPAGAASTGAAFQPTDRLCYVSGTRIATPSGEKRVEYLAAGDLVTLATEAGRSHQSVCRIGRCRIHLERHTHADLLAPVRIRSDALAQGQPASDVLVAPDQGILVDGALVPAWKLINDMTILQETDARTVDYYQVELENHGILLAGGLPVESYLDAGRCGRRDDADSDDAPAVQLWEQDSCFPRLTDPFASRQIWQRIAARAVQLGFKPTHVETEIDPDLHIVIDDQVVAPLLCTNNQYSFVLPKGTRHVVLASRAGRLTNSVHYVNDRRLRGVGVVSITLRGRGTSDVVIFPADHLPAGAGWHKPEVGPQTLRRWTDGAGELWFDTLSDARIMDVKLSGSMTYIVANNKLRGFA